MERPSDPRVLEREAQRARRVIQRLLELEAMRTPFRVLAQEVDLDAPFADRQLRLRVDRMDELEDGRILVIDYKSGNAEAMRLQEPAARPIQLAAYAAALQAQAPVKGVALLSLSPRRPGSREWPTTKRRFRRASASCPDGNRRSVAGTRKSAAWLPLTSGVTRGLIP